MLTARGSPAALEIANQAMLWLVDVEKMQEAAVCMIERWLPSLVVYASYITAVTYLRLSTLPFSYAVRAATSLFGKS